MVAAAGYCVFPVRPDSKIPAVSDWENRATTNKRQIYAWWANNSRKNIGIATGPSRLLVVDLDQSKGGQAPAPFTGARHGLDVLAQLAAEADVPVPTDTFTVETPGVIHGTGDPSHFRSRRSAGRSVFVGVEALSAGYQRRAGTATRRARLGTAGWSGRDGHLGRTAASLQGSGA